MGKSRSGGSQPPHAESGAVGEPRLRERCGTQYASQMWSTIEGGKSVSDYDKLKQQLIDLMGGLPERRPVQPQTVQRWERGDHFVEYVMYNGEPGERIPAYLLVPNTGYFRLTVSARPTRPPASATKNWAWPTRLTCCCWSVDTSLTRQCSRRACAGLPTGWIGTMTNRCPSQQPTSHSSIKNRVAIIAFSTSSQ